MTPRTVRLRLGKVMYNIQTSLSDATIERVQEILDLVSQQPTRGIGQEKMMLLACLQLAYALDVTTERLESLLEKLEQSLAQKSDNTVQA